MKLEYYDDNDAAPRADSSFKFRSGPDLARDLFDSESVASGTRRALDAAGGAGRGPLACQCASRRPGVGREGGREGRRPGEGGPKRERDCVDSERESCPGPLNGGPGVGLSPARGRRNGPGARRRPH